MTDTDKKSGGEAEAPLPKATDDKDPEAADEPMGSTLKGRAGSIFGGFREEEEEEENQKSLAKMVERVLSRMKVEDATTYTMPHLTSWGALFAITGSVWRRKTLWRAAWNVLFLSLCVTVFVYFVVEDHSRLQVGKFQKLGTFLNVFVGLLLGFFMSSSMKRWYDCANGFMVILDAIRNMQMELVAMGAPADKIDSVCRYGVLSTRLLNMELHMEALPQNQKKAAAEQMWALLTNTEYMDDTYGFMTEEEKVALCAVDDPSSCIWIWVGQIIGRMAQDGDIPPMATPTYGRMAATRMRAHSGIRMVRASILIQPPYIYVQTMATLVHINNIINGISFGLTLGTTLGSYLVYFEPTEGHHIRVSKVMRNTQSLLVSFGLSILGPLIYQALLEVSIAIAEPFSSAEGEFPAGRFIRQVECDLHSGKKMSAKLPGGWKPPCFRGK